MQPQEEQEEVTHWKSIVDHFKVKSRFGTRIVDREVAVDKWFSFKETLLGKWFVPFWSPLYFGLLHYNQRIRNRQLCKNPIPYKPYKYRDNDLTSDY